MLSFLSSAPDRRKEAREILRQTGKVVRYRRDVISPVAMEEITVAHAELAALVADKDSGKEALKAGTAKLAGFLRREGGRLFPFGAAADWTETFVIAAILAGGVRAFVFQPFKIPTNSMYPTFHGMTAEVYPDGASAPNAATRAWRKIVLGASYLAPEAPESGEILIPFARGFDNSIHVRPPEQGKLQDDGLLGTGLLKGPADRHTLVIALPSGGAVGVPVRTPAEFTFSSALLKAFFPKEAALPVTEQERWNKIYENSAARGDVVVLNGREHLRTHRSVGKGEPMLRFDVLTGDMVIVDRISYHFVKPKAGDDFVFRTRDVPGFKVARDDFYIKRLVGEPGDKLRVETPKLFRNGEPASGNIGFEMNNAGRADLEYYGYTPYIGERTYDLSTPYTVPAAHYWAMGDNSTNSGDSRDFGPVPEKALVGRAVFILHPFTSRWGVTK